MPLNTVKPTGIECPFTEDEMIVTKTDLKGNITYANDVFIRLSKYDQSDLYGSQHNIIRHPEMPRCIFDLLWDTLKNKKEMFAYVVNMARDGDHYWVFAHITPSFSADNSVVGYHSNRRKAREIEIQKITDLYAELRSVEQAASSPKDGLAQGHDRLKRILSDRGLEYDEFILTL